MIETEVIKNEGVFEGQGILGESSRRWKHEHQPAQQVVFTNEAKGVSKHHEWYKPIAIQAAKDTGKKKHIHPDAVKRAMNDHYLDLSLEDKKVYYLKAFPNADMEQVVLPSALEPAARKVALAAILAAAVAPFVAPAVVVPEVVAPAPEVVIQVQ